MKKIKLLLLVVSLFFMTGCVKLEMNLEISKNGKVSLGIIEAVQESLLDGEKILIDDELEKYKNQGLIIEDYEEDGMVGFKIVKKYSSIDKISGDKEANSTLDLENMNSDNVKLFSVKKGFFKNTYKANLKTTMADDLNKSIPSLDNIEEKIELDMEEENFSSDDEYENEDELDFENLFENDSDKTNPFGNDMDFSNYLSMRDIKFSVKLPYKVVKSNATDVSDGGKNLSWDLTKFSADEEMEFEFYLYNMKNIYLVGGGALLLIIIIVLAIVFINKGKNKKIDNNEEVVEEIKFDDNSSSVAVASTIPSTSEAIVPNSIISNNNIN